MNENSVGRLSDRGKHVFNIELVFGGRQPGGVATVLLVMNIAKMIPGVISVKAKYRSGEETSEVVIDG